MSNSDIRSRAPVPLDRCGMARASEILGDRWTLLILREAIYGVVRFADIQADTGAPRSVLSGRLARLVDAGLLTRFDYTEDGARARQGYRLTGRGRALATTFLAMKDWWDAGQESPPTVRFVPKGQTKPVRVALLDENGEEVDPADLKLQLD